MMRLLGRFIELAEGASAAGVHPDAIARLPCRRQLQRMGEDIGNTELGRFAELQSIVEREFAGLAPEQEGSDAAHG